MQLSLSVSLPTQHISLAPTVLLELRKPRQSVRIIGTIVQGLVLTSANPKPPYIIRGSRLFFVQFSPAVGLQPWLDIMDIN